MSRITGGDLGVDGLAAIKARLTPAQLAEAMRHDPNLLQPALYGLTPGWESLTLAGKPGLEPGKSGLEAQRLNAAMAPASGALRPAQPFVFKGSAEDRRRALRCLTQAVYFEAALEPDSGQAGVAQVVLNRVRDPNYANTVCGVVFEGAERTTGCQFSFTCDGSLAQAPVAWAWDRARRVAEKALDGAVAQQVGTANPLSRRLCASLVGADGRQGHADRRAHLLSLEGRLWRDRRLPATSTRGASPRSTRRASRVRAPSRPPGPRPADPIPTPLRRG